MKFLPVLDIMAGQVVRGIAGRRHEYRPIVSQITQSAAPLDVARAFRDHFALNEIYVADLDALAGREPAFATLTRLHNDGFRLWVDAGIATSDDAQPLLDAGVDRIVGGLESVAGPEVLRDLCQRHGAERIVFSLDLKAGVPMGRASQWSGSEAIDIAADAVNAGIGHILVLDLARVGVGEGTGTEDLCRALAARFPAAALAAGGGVRDRHDVQRLSDAGVTNVLVASCLHDGRFDRSWLTER